MQDNHTALSPDECRSLRCLAEMMIPASDEYDVPSAGDDVIFADILRSFGRDAEHVVAVLQMLDGISGGCSPIWIHCGERLWLRACVRPVVNHCCT